MQEGAQIRLGWEDLTYLHERSLETFSAGAVRAGSSEAEGTELGLVPATACGFAPWRICAGVRSNEACKELLEKCARFAWAITCTK